MRTLASVGSRQVRDRQRRNALSMLPDGIRPRRCGPRLATKTREQIHDKSALPQSQPSRALVSGTKGQRPATETSNDVADQRYRAGFRSGDDRRENPLSRLDRRQMGGAVLAP